MNGVGHGEGFLGENDIRFSDLVPMAEDDRPFDGILKLPDIPRPRVVQQLVPGPMRKADISFS